MGELLWSIDDTLSSKLNIRGKHAGQPIVAGYENAAINRFAKKQVGYRQMQRDEAKNRLRFLRMMIDVAGGCGAVRCDTTGIGSEAKPKS